MTKLQHPRSTDDSVSHHQPDANDLKIPHNQIIEEKQLISSHETQSVQYPIVIQCSNIKYVLPQCKALKTIPSELNIVEPSV